MGAAAGQPTRCCGSCDRQHQLKFGGGDRQAYASWAAEGDISIEHKEGLSSDARYPSAEEPRAPHGEHGPRLPPLDGMGSPGASEGTPVAAAMRDDRSDRELVVEIAKRHPEDDLGVQVLHRGIGVLVVAAIFSGGAVEAANEAHRRGGREWLQVQDLIVMINGVGGDDVAMAEECKRSQLLTLGVRRGMLGPEALSPL